MALNDDLPYARDAALVEEFQGGSSDAFSQLMRIHLPWVFALCRRIANQDQDAEDMCQEVFMEAYQGLPKLCQPRAFSAWLRRLAWRRCQRQASRTRRNTSMADYQASCNPWDAFVDEIDLGAAISRLTLTQRQVVVMSLVFGYDEKTMSMFLGIPRGTVKSRLHSARKRLQTLLTKEEGDNMAMDVRERIIKDVEDRIRRFNEEVYRGAVANPTPLDNNVKWWHDRRQADAESNAALYGMELEDVGPRMTRERMMTETLSFKSTREYWGVPASVEMLDGRDICRRLLISPFTLLKWVRQGMPCINFYPWRRYDLDLIRDWLANKGIEAPREVTMHDVDVMERYVLTEVQARRASVDDALEVLEVSF